MVEPWHRSCPHGLAGDLRGPATEIPTPTKRSYSAWWTLCVSGASVGGLFHSYQIVTTYSVSICSFSLRTAAIAVCVFKTAPGPSVARKSFISLSSLPVSPLLSNILTFILSLRSVCGGLFHFAREQSTTVRPMTLRVFN